MESHFSAPLAYLITFHTHGTWLPGDPRSSVDAHHRLRGSPRVGLALRRLAGSAQRLAHPLIELSPEERTVVLRTLQEVCRYRVWALYAAHVRVNHLHVLLRAEATPERVMNDLKAWTTRRVAEAGLRPRGIPLWVRHGSTRYLWRPAAVEAARIYVVDGQGGGKQWAVG